MFDLPSEVYRTPHETGHHREVVVAPTTPRVTVRPRHICAISPPWNGGRANEEDRSLRKKPWVSSLGGALLVLFSPRGEKSTPAPQESKENGGGSKPPPYGNGRTAARLRLTSAPDFDRIFGTPPRGSPAFLQKIRPKAKKVAFTPLSKSRFWCIIGCNCMRTALFWRALSAQNKKN